jgi:glycolate oxidase FAD binding subunit
VRDFILGVQFITGAGEIVRGGGKVVKNAAGFDFPKLLVGSLGRLGVIVEATFKVFPRPPAAGTLRVDLPDFAAACAILTRLAAAPFDLEGLELEPPSRIWLRLSGEAETLANRLAGLARLVGGRSERLDDESDSRFWRTPPWPALVLGALVVKVPTTPSVLPEFERMLEGLGAGRRYSAAGNVAWIVRDGGTDELDRALRARGLTGLVLQGAAPPPLIGAVRGEEFRRRIKAALDPNGIFPDF